VAKKKQKQKVEETIQRKGQVPYPVRVRIIQAVMRGSSHADVAVAFGVSTAVISKFIRLFNSGGMEALRPRQADTAAELVGVKRPRKRGGKVVEEVIAARAANPEWGTRRIRDVLARFEGLGVSETTVRRILHEAGLIAEREEVEPRDKPARRFERAEPNQLWQSDLFTFELRRHQRVYIVGFMDDYSRYLVSWAMAHHQKSSLVIEALERGIAEYGEPREVLTDQGRQYAAWRGTTEFQELLRRRGIAHSKSRPQHPETLGKVERFWKTLWEEFLRKTVFADFADCLRRVELFVQHYNFQRPHQGIDGAVPADRFFRAAPQVRAAVETQIKANALRLAQEKATQKPFYLVGRLGDQDLSIAATGGSLRVQVGDASQTIPMNKEQDDEAKATRVFRNADDEGAPTTTADAEADRGSLRATAAATAAQHRHDSPTQTSSLTTEADDETQTDCDADSDQGRSTTGTTPAWRAALADGSQGPGSGGAASDPPDPLGPVGAHTGDDGDHRAWDLAAALLPARDEGPGGDDALTRAWSERSVEPGRSDADAADRGAGGESGAPRAGEPPAGTAALSREEGAAGWAGSVSSEAGAEARPALDDRWARTFAWLEEADDGQAVRDFDPDDGWRDRAVRWNRKLAGADAPTEGEADGEKTSAERTFDVREPTRRPAGDQETLRRDPRGDGRAHDHQPSSARARDCASEHADARPSRGEGDRERAAAAPDGTVGEASDGETARSPRGPARERERETEAAAAGGGRHDDGRGGNHPQPARPATGYLEDFVSALEALAAETVEQRRRSGTSDDGVDASAGAGAPEDDGS
jgi:transposase InsO family protein